MHASRADLAHALQAMLMPFTELAERRGTTLTFTSRLSAGRSRRPGDLLRSRSAAEDPQQPRRQRAQVHESGRHDSPSRFAPAADGFAEIAVSDTGVGIPRAEMARVFERFYQIPGGRTSEGIGIGLALVKELVDLAPR